MNLTFWAWHHSTWLEINRYKLINMVLSEKRSFWDEIGDDFQLLMFHLCLFLRQGERMSIADPSRVEATVRAEASGLKWHAEAVNLMLFSTRLHHFLMDEFLKISISRLMMDGQMVRWNWQRTSMPLRLGIQSTLLLHGSIVNIHQWNFWVLRQMSTVGIKVFKLPKSEGTDAA